MEGSSMSTRQLTRLTLETQIKVADWLRANNDRLIKSETTFDEAAALVKKELDVETTGVNVRFIARSLNGSVSWNGRQGRKSGSGKTYADRTRVIAKALVDLHNQLGVAVPGDLQKVAWGVTIKQEANDDTDKA
jgi:hypothetical protein